MQAVPSAPFFISPEASGGGVVRLTDGTGIGAIPGSMLPRLHEDLKESMGDAASDLLYRSGYEWGLQEMLALSRAVKRERAGDPKVFWGSDARSILTQWWLPLAGNGWGVATFDVSALEQGLTFVELQSSAVAAAQHPSARPVCHLSAGLFAGAVSFFARSEYHAVEVQCHAMGHACCRFVAGPGAEIDSAEIWRQQGATAAEIIRRLR